MVPSPSLDDSLNPNVIKVEETMPPNTLTVENELDTEPTETSMAEGRFGFFRRKDGYGRATSIDSVVDDSDEDDKKIVNNRRWFSRSQSREEEEVEVEVEEALKDEETSKPVPPVTNPETRTDIPRFSRFRMSYWTSTDAENPEKDSYSNEESTLTRDDSRKSQLESMVDSLDALAAVLPPSSVAENPYKSDTNSDVSPQQSEIPGVEPIESTLTEESSVCTVPLKPEEIPVNQKRFRRFRMSYWSQSNTPNAKGNSNYQDALFCKEFQKEAGLDDEVLQHLDEFEKNYKQQQTLVKETLVKASNERKTQSGWLRRDRTLIQRSFGGSRNITTSQAIVKRARSTAQLWDIMGRFVRPRWPVETRTIGDDTKDKNKAPLEIPEGDSTEDPQRWNRFRNWRNGRQEDSSTKEGEEQEKKKAVVIVREGAGNVAAAVKKAGVAVGGGCMVAVGVPLLLFPVPGPGVAMLATGVYVLSTEFESPKRWLTSVKTNFGPGLDRMGLKLGPNTPAVVADTGSVAAIVTSSVTNNIPKTIALEGNDDLHKDKSQSTIPKVIAFEESDIDNTLSPITDSKTVHPLPKVVRI